MIRLKTDTRIGVIEIQGVADRLSDLTPAFNDFHAYMIRRTVLMFRRLRQGGTFRSATWAPWADQYTRATDGVTVPAWGGVDRIRAGRSARNARGGLTRGAFSDLKSRQLRGQRSTGGKVRGRLRASKKRVSKGSSLMADKGRLRQALLTDMRIRRGRVLTMDTPVPYADAQHAMRPFQYFEDPTDVNFLRKQIVKHLSGANGQ